MTPKEAAAKLYEARLTDSVIAARVGSTQSTINKIRRGLLVPTYPVGKALVDLARRTK